MAQDMLWVVIMLIGLAIVFDFMNGFHDAANSIATIVSTGVLKPAQAVVFAAFFNFVAVFVFHNLHVAATVGKGIVLGNVVDTHVIFGALIGAIIWSIITWFYGIPSSSSHALIGGRVGAVALAHHGAHQLDPALGRLDEVAEQRGQLRVHLKNNRAAIAAVSAGRATFFDELFTAKRDAAIAARSRFYPQLDLIENLHGLSQNGTYGSKRNRGNSLAIPPASIA